MRSTIRLGIGSNSGERRQNICRALAAISALFGPEATLRQSPFYASEPMGFDSPNEFLNIVAEITTERSRQWTADEAHALLRSTQAIEKSISSMPHRNPDGSYRDREIDIDLLSIDNLVVNSELLTLPHPGMAQRPFVQIPLKQLQTTKYETNR